MSYRDTMLDALTTAEVQALRLKLHDFASRHNDQVVKICCSAVDLDLARIVGRQDDQTSANWQLPSNNSLRPCKLRALLIKLGTLS
jgi:hypothetical protein